MTSANTAEELLDVLQRIAREATGKQTLNVTMDMAMADMDIDSILVAEMVCGIEDACGVELSIEKWRGIRTVRELAEAVLAARTSPCGAPPAVSER